jgi:hypothetical protein
MKKLIVVLVLALFLATAVSVVAVELDLTGEDNRPTTLFYVEPKDGTTPYFVKKYEDGTISDETLKVITFTDTHLGNGTEPSDVISLTIIDRVLKEKHPDLVVFTGDVCLGYEPFKGVDSLSKVFEENKTYWAVVLGNHDAEPEDGPTREELIRYYESKPYSLTKEGEIDEGEGNYMINHLTSKGVTHTLVFIDSGGYVTPEVCAKYGYTYRDGYDFIKPEQLNWYKSTLEETQRNNGGIMPTSTMFMHIPVVEHSYVNEEAFLYGHKLEPSCPSKINSGVFAFVKELGSTKTIVCGHDHVNNYAVMYEGIKLMYSQSCSFGSYGTRDNLFAILLKSQDPTFMNADGHTEFSINADGTCVDTPCYNDLNLHLFEGLEDEFKENNTPYPNY